MERPVKLRQRRLPLDMNSIANPLPEPRVREGFAALKAHVAGLRFGSYTI